MAGRIREGFRSALRYAGGGLCGVRTTVYIVNGERISAEKWEAKFAPDMQKIEKAFDELSSAMDRIFKKAGKP